MRRVAIVTTSTVAGVILLLSLKPHAGSAVTAAQRGIGAQPPAAGSTAAPGTSSGSGSSSGSGGGSLKSGTYTGDAIDTRFGPVQVQATISGGKLTAVKVLQVPDDDPREDFIVTQDVPVLTQEALAAGNASIDSVSGATFTSMGYVQSLQSALDRARA